MTPRPRRPNGYWLDSRFPQAPRGRGRRRVRRPRRQRRPAGPQSMPRRSEPAPLAETPAVALAAEAAGLSVREAQKLVDALVRQGRMVKVGEDLYYPTERLDALMDRLAAAMQAAGQLTLAEARDLLGTSRKYAQALLEHMDSEGPDTQGGGGAAPSAPPPVGCRWTAVARPWRQAAAAPAPNRRPGVSIWCWRRDWAGLDCLCGGAPASRRVGGALVRHAERRSVWWPARSSKPVLGGSPVQGGFDSHAAPPC